MLCSLAVVLQDHLAVKHLVEVEAGGYLTGSTTCPTSPVTVTVGGGGAYTGGSSGPAKHQGW